MSSVADLLPISEVSRRSGVAASALRFYEDRGLIASERAGSGIAAIAAPCSAASRSSSSPSASG